MCSQSTANTQSHRGRQCTGAVHPGRDVIGTGVPACHRTSRRVFLGTSKTTPRTASRCGMADSTRMRPVLWRTSSSRSVKGSAARPMCCRSPARSGAGRRRRSSRCAPGAGLRRRTPAVLGPPPVDAASERSPWPCRSAPACRRRSAAQRRQGRPHRPTRPHRPRHLMAAEPAVRAVPSQDHDEAAALIRLRLLRRSTAGTGLTRARRPRPRAPTRTRHNRRYPPAPVGPGRQP